MISLTIGEEIKIRDTNGGMVFNPELGRLHVARCGSDYCNLDGNEQADIQNVADSGFRELSDKLCVSWNLDI